MTTYLLQETADSLILSYELLARAHRKKHYINKNSTRASTGAYATSFPLLILNASIIEGIMRLWVARGLKKEINNIITERSSIGKNKKNKAEMLLEKYLIDTELNGGNSKLKEQFLFTFGVPIDKLPKFDDTPIRVLFTLRNILAHGTAFISPATPKPNKSQLKKTDYIDAWENKSLIATELLRKEFKSHDILSALNNFEVPQFFFDKSKEYLELIHKEIEKHNIDTGTAFNQLKKLEFGFISRT